MNNNENLIGVSMKITDSWIKKWKPCIEAINWLKEQDTREVMELADRLKKSKLETEQKWEWIIWALPRLLKTKRARIKLAVYCAELALSVFEKKMPEDKRPREAIIAVRKWLKSPSKSNKDNAFKAMEEAVRAATGGTWAIWHSGWAAVEAAQGIQWAAVEAARSAAWEAIMATGLKETILAYGLALVKDEKKT
jgi:hypothetical protein